MLEIKVVIADDHPIVLFGVREIIMRDPGSNSLPKLLIQAS